MNRFLQLVRVKYPIIQAPMLGVTTPEMVAAAVKSGSLGSLPLGGVSPTDSLKLIQQTKQLINQNNNNNEHQQPQPFAVNLFTYTPSKYESIDPHRIDQMKNHIITNTIKIEKKEIKTTEQLINNNTKYYVGEDLVDVIIDQGIKIVSFTFGVLSLQSIKRLRDDGCVLIGTATSVQEALYLERYGGVDIICAQGYEAGGHRGSFLSVSNPNNIIQGGDFEYKDLPKVGLMSLLAQIVDNVSPDIPVIAAGGLVDGRSCSAAFTLGASAVQLGTVLLTSKESSAQYKSSIIKCHHKETTTSLTRSFSGRYARGIPNRFMEEMDKPSSPSPLPYPFQLKLVSSIRSLAADKTTDNTDYISQWAGQNMSKCGTNNNHSTYDILTNIITDLNLNNNNNNNSKQTTTKDSNNLVY
ncbi:hypothetical protein DFA_00864 [Cavenderia fasciculata]|uniref:Nitronate monooxygenase domain-containing protein n=1 Tax=Cavenderia fasciculata TaxID=261658 RepID=F4PU69_CACFS|nr:uncharacterized protein DFA_00864 [Cavenderia fasciculata]EGG20995.1 hypothetical protein DFA_00864 [Cavenderia fasciculata]|eukprot:XP_004358845.1 hypothetical protein DFA_00864 [Cavenderia fasciculata]